MAKVEFEKIPGVISICRHSNADCDIKPMIRFYLKSEGVRTERWKYIRYLDMTPHVEELYDLQADPQELRNLAADPECRDVLEDLRKRYQQYRKDLLDNAPDPGEYSQDGNA